MMEAEFKVKEMSSNCLQPVYIESFSAWQVLVQEAQAATLKLNRLLEFCLGVFQCARQISSTGANLLMPVSSSEVWYSSVQGNKAVYLVLSTYFRDWFGRYLYLIVKLWVAARKVSSAVIVQPGWCVPAFSMPQVQWLCGCRVILAKFDGGTFSSLAYPPHPFVS